MYTGQVAVITNREDWISDFIQLTDEDNGNAVINILDPVIGFDCEVYVSDMDNCQRLVPATIENGGVVVSAGDAPNEPGFQWTFNQSQLSSLCAGTYRCGVKVTINGVPTDVVVGTISVIEGNR